MISYISAALILVLAVVTDGFVHPTVSFSPGVGSHKISSKTTVKSVFTPASRVARRKSAAVQALRMAATKEASNNFWEGEWVCADCGYIYDVDDCGGLYLEQQPRGFVCPQCRGPRRRFAKKVGDKVGITQDGGDAPILLFSFLGLAATVAFGFWFNGQ